MISSFPDSAFAASGFFLKEINLNPVFVSAYKKIGLDELKEGIIK